VQAKRVRGGEHPGNRPRPVLKPHPDALQPVAAGLQRVSGGVQGGTKVGLVVCPTVHSCRSRTDRNACIALAVWLFTAPRLIRMVSAICASGMSA
jgi:hypothetical protein